MTNISLPWAVSKSTAAFYMTCERLFNTQEHVYFWTFTFKKTHCDWQYQYAWRVFIRDVAHEFGGMVLGVKVTEVHPGTSIRASHGLHYHCLLNVRLPISVMRRIGNRYGLGRMSVELADENIVHYLAKYLMKRNGPKLMKGMRRWSTVGGFCGVKKNKVVVESIPVDCLRGVTAILGQLSIKYTALLYSYAKHYGHIHEWGFDVRRKFLRFVAGLCKHDTVTFWNLARIVLNSYTYTLTPKVYELQYLPDMSPARFTWDP